MLATDTLQTLRGYMGKIQPDRSGLSFRCIHDEYSWKHLWSFIVEMVAVGSFCSYLFLLDYVRT